MSECPGPEPHKLGEIFWEGRVMNDRDMPGEIRSSIVWGPIAHTHSWENQAIGLSSAVLERAGTVGTGLAEVMTADEPRHGHGAPTLGPLLGLFCSCLSSRAWLQGAGLPFLCSQFLQGSPRSQNNSGGKGPQEVHLPAQIRVSTVVKGFMPAGS